MTKLVIVVGVIVVGLLVWVSVDGFTAGAELLITAAVLLLLIAGGNLLGGSRHPARPHDPDPDEP